MAKNTQKKGALGMFENMSSVSPVRKQKIGKRETSIKQANVATTAEITEKNETLYNEEKTQQPVKKELLNEKPQKKQNGRPNKRGKKGEDFYMLNIAIPKDIYEQLKVISMEKAAGNMTYLINKIIKDAISGK